MTIRFLRSSMFAGLVLVPIGLFFLLKPTQNEIEVFKTAPGDKIAIISHLYPADMVDLAALEDNIQESGAQTIFILGDIGYGEVAERWADELFKRYKVYAVFGNADPMKPKVWQDQGLTEVTKMFDHPYWVERLSNYLVIGLNSMDCEGVNHHEGCWFKREQLDFFKNVINSAMSDTSIVGVMVLIHHVFWVNGMLSTPEAMPLIKSTCRRDKNKEFRCPWHDDSLKNPWLEVIHPSLKALSDSGKKVYVFGGDSSMNSQLTYQGVSYHSTGYRNKSKQWDWFTPDIIEFMGINLSGIPLQVHHLSFVRPPSKND